MEVNGMISFVLHFTWRFPVDFYEEGFEICSGRYIHVNIYVHIHVLRSEYQYVP